VVELLIRGGASGVLIAGCPPRDCLGREGPKWLRERLYNDREAELQPRVDRRRVRTVTFAPGALTEALEAHDSFAAAVRDIEAERVDSPIDELLELECEPAPVEETA
ncbi:MAG TPA: hydrogenase iron-sulfur subunit, partial [Gemmatimonadales bacterium]|nr:hydrogenase iron-sulfur subunit [Gemmatimonadales bacterium]